jgi:hypothetical protein
MEKNLQLELIKKISVINEYFPGISIQRIAQRWESFTTVIRCYQCGEYINRALKNFPRSKREHNGTYRDGYEHGWTCCSAKRKKDPGCEVFTQQEHDIRE